MDCERQAEGHAELQTGEDYTCSMCKHAASEPVPTRTETEESKTHTDVETQPAQSDMDREPTQMDSTEPGRTVGETQHEVEDPTEHKGAGKIGL